MSEFLLWQRTDALATSPNDLVLFFSNQPFTDQTVSGTETSAGVTTIRSFESLATGRRLGLDLAARYVRLQRQGTGTLRLSETEILGPASNALANIPPATVASESHVVDSDSPNPLLDQLGYFALNTDRYPAGLDVTKTSTGVDLHFERHSGLDALLVYSLELSSDLIAWLFRASLCRGDHCRLGRGIVTLYRGDCHALPCNSLLGFLRHGQVLERKILMR